MQSTRQGLGIETSNGRGLHGTHELQGSPAVPGHHRPKPDGGDRECGEPQEHQSDQPAPIGPGDDRGSEDEDRAGLEALARSGEQGPGKAQRPGQDPGACAANLQGTQETGQEQHDRHRVSPRVAGEVARQHDVNQGGTGGPELVAGEPPYEQVEEQVDEGHDQGVHGLEGEVDGARGLGW